MQKFEQIRERQKKKLSHPFQKVKTGEVSVLIVLTTWVFVLPCDSQYVSQWHDCVLFIQANGEDSDSEYGDEAEETALESYSTPLDSEDCPVDEYQVFINSLQG